MFSFLQNIDLHILLCFKQKTSHRSSWLCPLPSFRDHFSITRQHPQDNLIHVNQLLQGNPKLHLYLNFARMEPLKLNLPRGQGANSRTSGLLRARSHKVLPHAAWCWLCSCTGRWQKTKLGAERKEDSSGIVSWQIQHMPEQTQGKKGRDSPFANKNYFVSSAASRTAVGVRTGGEEIHYQQFSKQLLVF